MDRAELAQKITAAIESAIAGCDHPDPGGPIWDPVRPCSACSTAAALAVLEQAGIIPEEAK